MNKNPPRVKRSIFNLFQISPRRKIPFGVELKDCWIESKVRDEVGRFRLHHRVFYRLNGKLTKTEMLVSSRDVREGEFIKYVVNLIKKQ